MIFVVDMVDKVLAFIAHNDDDSVEVEVREEEQGAVYELGSAYTEDRDVTLYPVFEKLVTVTAPFTMTVEQGGNTAPGKTDFELVLIDGSGNELTYEDEYFVAGGL